MTDVTTGQPTDLKHLLPLGELRQVLGRTEPFLRTGRVTRVIGLTVEADGPGVEIGQLCSLWPRAASEPLLAEVVGFRSDRVLLMPLGELVGVGPGTRVVATGRELVVPVGEELRGRVLDGLGVPIDGGAPLHLEAVYPASASPPGPLDRAPVTSPLEFGVRAIDGLLTCGRGQRIGIFAGSGVGKSTLLGMVALYARADVVVVGLVGERGREVRHFIEHDLGPEGLQNAVVVAATSDRPALVRIKAAHVATAVAEYFRDQGYEVLLLMDSLTRVAMAQRELGLAIGEPPSSRGYPPSIFAMLPRLLERAGTSQAGTITALYTVLVEGDDFNEPVTDAVRGVLDGHIVLSRELADAAHYPAIDVLQSVSRLMSGIVSDRHARAARKLRELLAEYRRSEDLVTIGAYKSGTNPLLDEALRRKPRIDLFLQQGGKEQEAFESTVARLVAAVDGDSREGEANRGSGLSPEKDQATD